MGKRTIWREVGERECGGGRGGLAAQASGSASASVLHRAWLLGFTGLHWLLFRPPMRHGLSGPRFLFSLNSTQKLQRMYAGVHTYMTTEGAKKRSARDTSAYYHSMLTWSTFLKISATAAKVRRSQRHITVSSSKSLHGYTNGSSFPSFPENVIVPNSLLP